MQEFQPVEDLKENQKISDAKIAEVEKVFKAETERTPHTVRRILSLKDYGGNTFRLAEESLIKVNFPMKPEGGATSSSSSTI